jgi:glycosyltransferase involved in cell wall biosynthesis
MRLIYCNQVDLSEKSGQGRHEFAMAERLINDKILDGYYVGQKPKDEIIKAGDRCIYIPIKKSLLGYYIYQLRLFSRVWELSQNPKETVIFVRYSPAMISPFLISIFLRIPMVVRTGPVLDNLDAYFKRVSRITRLIVYVTSWANYKTADKIIVVTQTIGMYVKNRFRISEDKIYKSQNGFDDKIFFISKQTSNKYCVKKKVIFAGTLDIDQGVDDFIHAMNIVIKEYGRDICGLIVGDGYRRNHLEDLVLKYKLSNQIQFTGYVTQEAVCKYLNISDVAIATFKSKALKRTGSSALKLYEYLGAGKYVIATRHADHQFLEDNDLGILCDTTSIREIADSINMAIDRADSRKKQEARRKYVMSRGTWDHAYKRLIQICRKTKKG